MSLDSQQPLEDLNKLHVRRKVALLRPLGHRKSFNLLAPTAAQTATFLYLCLILMA